MATSDKPSDAAVAKAQALMQSKAGQADGTATSFPWEGLHAAIAAALDDFACEAVAAERERCARVAEGLDSRAFVHVSIAARIRAGE